MGRSLDDLQNDWHEDWHEQLLPFETSALTPAAWQDALGEQLAQPCQVVYGRSRGTPVQVQRPAGQPIRVRLHRFFEAAPGPVITALGRWIKVGARARAASRLLDSWIATQLTKLPRPAPGRLCTRGLVHDLDPMLERVLSQHLLELRDAPPAVTWGPRRRSRSRRSLHLGSYDPDTRVVRIHPVLDHRAVPEFFVRFVLFHELLHAVIPPGRRPGSRHHPPAFRQRERAHPDYQLAVEFEVQHLPRWIRRARRGYQPIPPS